MNILTEAEIWEKHSTPKQIKIRDRIEKKANKLRIPPSEHEANLIVKGNLHEDWDFNQLA